MAARTETFYDERSGTAAHLVACERTGACAVFDPVFDLDPKSGHTSAAPVERVAAHIRAHRLRLDWILETHIHHDHVSGAAALRDRLGGRIAIGDRVAEVADVIGEVYDLPENRRRPAAFDGLLADGERLPLGELTIEVLATPGHTLDHLSYVVGNVVILGDTLFMPDSGTARCDFHGGDARALYRSIQRLLDRPDDTRLLACHDYGAYGARPPAWESTVGAQKTGNIHLGGRGEAAFVGIREERDRSLDMPALLLHSLPLNIRAGRLPAPDAEGRILLTIPLDVPRDAM